MARTGERLERLAQRVLVPADAAVNRLYRWRYNPLYHSGALVVALLGVVLVTGIYLLLFYRVGSPYGSVARLTEQVWVGRWVRSLHRYASDAAVAAAAIHAFRLFAQGRSWGPRALAWISGLGLLFIILVCGWTGYVMVWDVQGVVLAKEGARFLDVLPLFSEPIGRAFVGDRPIPNAFFFLNLFLHVALPIGMGVVLWIHVSRVARPGLLPPKRLTWSVAALLLGLSLLWPVGMAPAADLFSLAGRAPYDAFFAFWLPLTRAVPAGVVWLVGGGLCLVAVLTPLWAGPGRSARPSPSQVNQRLCDGCEQCYHDCPYEAITMVARHDDREGMVSSVDPALCVSCGICAGSCAPMGIGPPGRTGRHQLAQVREFLAARRPGPRDVVIVACTCGVAGRAGERDAVDGAAVFPVDCAGSMHSSVVELIVRSGVAGVLIVACPPRDCWNREGPRWLEQRLYHDREAELKARVDRRRVRLVYAGRGEGRRVREALRGYRALTAAMETARGEHEIDIDRSCDIVSEEVASS